MEFDPYQYPRLVLLSEKDSTDIFFDRRDLKECIPFAYNINIPVHRWFYFEHGFSAKLIDTLLSEVKVTRENILYDPFCGIGTAPVTSIMKGIPAFGSDISPFCVFMTNTKLKALSEADTEELMNVIERFRTKPLPLPSDSGYDYLKLDTKNMSQDILSLKESIEEFEEGVTKNLCKLALLSIVELLSRNPAETQSVKRLFLSKLTNIIEDLVHIRKIKNEFEFPNGKAIVGDARDLILIEKADIVIASPPYLDFYDYTNKYKREHALYFTSTSEELKKIRRKTIRSHKESSFVQPSTHRIDALVDLLEDIPINNPEHRKLAYDYFEDMWLVFKNLSRNITQDGLVFFIVENLEYSDVILEVDIILSRIAIDTGFSMEGILVTNQHRNNRRDSIVVVRKS
jgi:adenine-specific DNA methylase